MSRGFDVKNEYTFKFKELIFLLFKKKICPNCGSQELVKHTDKKFEEWRRSSLTYMKVYSCRIIYECQSCKKRYTIDGLMNNYELNDKEENVVVDDTKDDEKYIKYNKRVMRRSTNIIFLPFWTFVLLALLIEKQFIMFFLVAPIIIFAYFVFMILTK
ncbi:hypothetical protein [Defluviitalea phaphyphila]|uniref:hypothetical protein n=1 Tax=Defluviitalea phaphyphila TaxID=1473580 RepID=UPI00072FE2FB|nr:hypothetical protein [Defluviitalea phaphyphila]